MIIFLAPLLRRGGSTARVDTTNAHRAAAPARTTFAAGALGYTLNLLRVFDAVREERSVLRASQKVCLSQSAAVTGWRA